jgi:protein involved in polysaccharide export with SLBB domain
LLSAASGCSTAGGTFTLFPTGHFLLRTSKDLASVAQVPAPTPRELDRTVLADYYVEPGDVLLLEPASLDSPIRFPGDQSVLADGSIDMGRFGRVVVAGRTVEQIEQLVTRAVEAVEGKIDPINVRLISPQGAVYYVLGEVNAPGSFPLIGRETVLDAIIAAGGLSNRASSCDIILSRPTHPNNCRVVLPVCYRQITQLGDTSTNYQIMPGDRIFVATRSLGESLLPWRQHRECPLCCASPQCPCPDPSLAAYQPSITVLPVGPGQRPPPPELIQSARARMAPTPARVTDR